MSNPAPEPRSDLEQLTSFGFLDEADESQESVFGFGSILSRVRSALAPAETSSSTEVNAAPNAAHTGMYAPPVEGGESLSGTVATSKARDTSASRTLQLGAISTAASSRDTSIRSVEATPTPTAKSSSSQLSTTALSQRVLQTGKKPSRVGGSMTPQRGVTGISKSKKLSYPFPSSSFAPAITSTAAAHAVAPQRFQSITPDSLRQDENDDGEDVLTSLMRKSGVDQSRRKAGTNFSTIPGFPLSKDTLADDTRSVHSSSSRLPRSDSFSTSEAQLVVAQPHLYSGNDGDVSASLSASADAFRRMRGEGTVLSRSLWMPDETVKECRECQSYFTPFRRKHHCRICGLVYCSRCASNIVSGRRFGLDKAEIRVCNYCIRVLSEYERAGQQSGKDSEAFPSSSSVNTSPHRIATSFARKRTDSNGLSSRPDKANISAPLEALSELPQSQFTANQLFSHPRGAIGSSLSLAQGLPRLDSLQDMLLELEDDERQRTNTSMARAEAEVTKHSEQRESTSVTSKGNVPFRVDLNEDESVPTNEDELPLLKSPDPTAAFAKAVIMATPHKKIRPATDEVGPTKTLRLRDVRSKAFGESSVLDARERGVGEAALRALRKSKLRARILEGHDEHSSSNLATRTALHPKNVMIRKISLTNAPPAGAGQLDDLSERHFSALLHQTLSRAGIRDVQKWEVTLRPLLLNVVRNIQPRPRSGESMDVRQYIKFKRVPGGSISDSSYVDGFVLSKQVATKKMARTLPLNNPRVMIVAFPIDFYQADEQFMSLQPLLEQEHEYTRILVARILQLRPNVLIVKDTVSRLALDMLEESGVIVVWSIKLSAVQAISRCCQADIIPSVERLALEPRLGRCASFSVETFQHAASPQCRKSLMRFCTAGNARSLGCSIVLRGAPLSALGIVKSVSSLLVYAAHNLRLEEQLHRDEGAHVQSEGHRHDRQGSTTICPGSCEDEEDDELWQRILAALLPFETSILSASASITIPPPYQLVKMKETHRRLKCLQRDCLGDYSLLASVGVAEADRSTLSLIRGQQGGVSDNEKGSEEKTEKVTTLADVMPKPSVLQAEYAKALMEHQLFLKEWASCSKSDPSASLRRISVLWAMISTVTHKPCIGPRLLSHTFYGEQDETLGRFLERTCDESRTICSAKGCGRPRGVHYSSFVHNDTRVQVVLERFVCPIAGQENRLLMWSYCKRCERATPVTPVSDDTWSLSFAKYLELHFYDGDKTTMLCGHDYYNDFIRFFSLQNLAIRFHRDRDLVVRDVVLPPMRVLQRPDVDYKLKVESATSLQERMDAYWQSVHARLAAIRKEPSLSIQHLSQLEGAIKSAKSDEEELKMLLIETCRSSDQTDILSLNAVRNRLQAFVVRWDHFFQDFERTALPSERDLRRMTSHHLSRIFNEKSEGSQASEQVCEVLGLTPAEEVDEGGLIPTPTGTSSQDDVPVATAVEVRREACDAPLSDSTSAADGTLSPSPSSPVLNSPAPWRKSYGNVAPLAVSQSSDALDAMNTSGMSDSDVLSPHVARPAFRRGKTSDAVRRVSGNARKSPKDAGPSIPRTTHLPSVGQAVRRAALPNRGPPSSYKPPRSLMGGVLSSGVDTESDNNSSAKNCELGTRRKLSSTQRRGRNQALVTGKDPSSTQAGTDDTGTRTSMGITGPGKRASRVTTIARRFDNLHREAERERERQRQVRARRARPVGASQATVQVYRSVKDAVRDDEESDTSEAESRADDAEAEDEADTDADMSASNKPVRRYHGQQRGSGSTIRAGGSTIKGKKDLLKAAGGTIKGSSAPSVQAEETADPVSAEDGKDQNKALLNVPPSQSESEGLPDVGQSTLTPSTSTSLASVLASPRAQGSEASGYELTVSSLLSGTLPASWRASLLPLDGDTPEGRGSLLKTITSLWARGTLNLPIIELPIRSTEHLFSDSPLVVLREDEPSSLVAFTLNSSTYASRLETLNNRSAVDTVNVGEKTVDSWQMIGANSDGVAVPHESGVDEALRQTEGTHLNFQFNSGDSRFSIRVLFTEQFDALRKACECRRTFVQSLSRCSNWSECSGGKSGAAMMKTLDDRFIIKQLSRTEMDAFASNAGAYFRFLADVLSQDRPTTLAKIYGVYRLSIRNAQTGKTIKLDCAITENVFANAKMAQIFDLKGALRNRFVQPTGQTGQVLLDGNLVAAKSPIFLREGSKHILRQALFHDSLFLANCDVMDYSLVVGVCEGAAELRVGIIDFIRTFTFGKKAESFLKEAVGGHGSEAPTIIDPKQYRMRFLAFLDSVLLLSPDHWLSEEEEMLRSAEMQCGSSSGNTGNAGAAALHANHAVGQQTANTGTGLITSVLGSTAPSLVMV